MKNKGKFVVEASNRMVVVIISLMIISFYMLHIIKHMYDSTL